MAWSCRARSQQNSTAHEQRFLLTDGQGLRPRLPPGHPAGPLRRGTRGRRRGQARHRRDVPRQHDHGEALRGVPAAGRRRAGPRGASPHPPPPAAAAGREQRAAVKLRARWLIPLAALPVVGLLAYGFRTDPRAVPSPLVGRPAPPFALTTFDGKPVSLESLARQGRRPELLGVVVLPRVLRGSAGPRGRLAPVPAEGRGGARRGHPGQGSGVARLHPALRPHLPERARSRRQGLDRLRRLRGARDLRDRPARRDPPEARRRASPRRCSGSGWSRCSPRAPAREARDAAHGPTGDCPADGPLGRRVGAPACGGRPGGAPGAHGGRGRRPCGPGGDGERRGRPRDRRASSDASCARTSRSPTRPRRWRIRCATSSASAWPREIGPEQVKAYFVQRYGDWVLLAPPARGLNLVLWLAPFGAVAGGLVVVVTLVRRWRRQARGRRPSRRPAVGAADRERLAAELERLGD